MMVLRKTLCVLFLLMFGLVGVGKGAPSIAWSESVELTLPTELFSLDLNDDAFVDFIIGYPPPGSFLLLMPQANSEFVGEQTSASVVSPRPLDVNTLIGDTLQPGLTWGANRADMAGYLVEQNGGGLVAVGPWAGVTNGLLGVQFDIAGESHYGWVRVTDRGPFVITIHEWAYETQPGIGIPAGMIPEPSALLLFFSGVSVIAWKRWRRRRSASCTAFTKL
jgi:hypothetical protein